MAELEIDQSHLPRVQEVCQNFAVLEDGALANSLQEQEIEHYYTNNIQKNQLVQNDIRVAKRLQDEEEERRAQDRALLRQESRQLEEQDFEYARVIQEEIQRCAEEARRRELDDEEMAKQIQAEEEQRIRRTREGSGSSSELTSPLQQHAHNSPVLRRQHYPPTSNRWRHSTSDYSSQHYNEPRADSPRREACLRSSKGQPHSFREEALSGDSDGSDTVFSERSSVTSKTLPLQYQPQNRNYRSLMSHKSFSKHCHEWEREQLPEDYYENDHLENKGVGRSRDPYIERERNDEGWHSNRDQELAEVGERRCSRSESVRLPDRRRQSFREAAKTWAYKDNPDKHVRFRDDASKSDRSRNGSSRQVWEMLGQVLWERGVPVRLSNNGAPLQIGAQRRDSQALYGSEASRSDTQPHHRAFQRAATARHSFHGDIGDRRRQNGDGQDRHYENVCREITTRDSNDFSRQRHGSRRWNEHKYIQDGDRDTSENRIRRTTSERKPGHKITRDGSEEERPNRRIPQRSQSLSSNRHRSRHILPSAERERTNLEMGELQQVLQDEELARKLQEEEETVLSRDPQPSPRNSHPEGDFRVAQVAQDEEIARYMQKQEIKSKRRSRELEGPVSWREHRSMMSQHDRRTRDRQVPRERLDSEGLPSPTDDCSPEDQPHSPVSTLPNPHSIRNIAEELDPTFQARRPGTDSLRAAQTGSTCAPLPAQQSGLLEEPTFIPPTKRQVDKSVRPKSKEKKENCKQQ